MQLDDDNAFIKAITSCQTELMMHGCMWSLCSIYSYRLFRLIKLLFLRCVWVVCVEGKLGAEMQVLCEAVTHQLCVDLNFPSHWLIWMGWCQLNDVSPHLWEANQTGKHHRAASFSEVILGWEEEEETAAGRGEQGDSLVTTGKQSMVKSGAQLLSCWFWI